MAPFDEALQTLRVVVRVTVSMNFIRIVLMVTDADLKIGVATDVRWNEPRLVAAGVKKIRRDHPNGYHL